MSDIPLQLHHIQQRIARACAQAGRSADQVQLLAVSKTFGTDAIAQAIAAGQLAFGENYVTEAVTKIQHFMSHAPSLQWHMIGPLQSNKTRAVAQHFQWVHSVDRMKIARRLSEQRPDSLDDLQVCLEVNVSAEQSKSGVMPEEVAAMAAEIVRLPKLKLRGLMCIPEPSTDPVAQRQPFALLRELLHDLQRAGHAVDTLSMGMSDDLEAAIQEGATIVRVGRAIFGQRDYGQKVKI
ncbi:hypothetical protein CUZ56_02950 [Saezia sanguinis]|jgi:pyridoxal phosphate enzyme (YggS family)|uniref:Pyridoxal phosphate homeostasis protein n=1 Tax=Saezia sanguinis TaxID=1965230 RepID=A0A433S9R6_9BURK|nr:YggS family pyridoxal phosphate-dependent enzyme [Saezia sanguinis]RUS65493.1 hypothetical protein CUZ56_02950 [Saezia sanguinis]